MDAILAHYQSHLSEITLKPSSGGVFDITVDGEVVFSKHDAGRFPEQDEVIRLVGERIRA